MVELIAVMTIAAILAAAAVPAMTTLRAARIESAQLMIVRDLGYARDRAVATGTPHRVAFDVIQQQYRLMLVPSGDPASQVTTSHTTPAGGEYVVRFGQNEFSGVLLVSASLGGGASVTFDWRGTPHGAGGTPLLSGTHEVRLAGGRGVRLRAITGLAERFSY
ncbi:GspH/FimT family protein [Leptolyngbya sp. 15MV]|nr:GspH/FimT family protein [Leptolyngbya sp. 15MV]